MATNPGYEFTNAEKHYDEAQTDEERLLALEEMIRTMPGHKSAEALRANLRSRYKRIKVGMAEKKKRGKQTNKEAIKKATCKQF